MNKNIIVTGGAGYIGSHTVVELLAQGYKPIIIDNFCNSEKSVLKGLEDITGKRIDLFEGDCTDKNFMTNVFAKTKPVGVIHFAAFKAVGESVEKPLAYYQNNVVSLLVLLEVMKKQNCKRLVFSSSCTVYGTPKKLPVTEQSPTQKAISPYGNTKQIAEDIIKDQVVANTGLSAVALRYFNPIGAHPSALIGELPLGIPSNLVPFVTQTAAGLRNELTIFGNDYNTPDGTNVRDYIHVVDLAKAHVKTLDYLYGKSNFYDFINIGTGTGTSVLEIVKTFEKVSNQKLNYTIGNRRAGDVDQIYASVDKSKEVLNWKTELSVEDALKDSWNWQLNLSH
ncbi:MAG: UDP-glucose 4-epimerase GalE [Cyclobacteriaceae bacterium]|nr:UDP-glucose 4-epimerase GalE [Cyclobacteriaceae bacterium]